MNRMEWNEHFLLVISFLPQNSQTNEYIKYSLKIQCNPYFEIRKIKGKRKLKNYVFISFTFII